MALYKVVFGSGFFWNYEEMVFMDEATTNTQAIVDKAIDQIEERGEFEKFVRTEISGDILDDEYVIGGNHCRKLYHHGEFYIQEIKYQDDVREDGLTDFDGYSKLMKILDDVALGNKNYSEVSTEIFQLGKYHSLQPESVGDANDAYGNTWEEVINGLRENFKNGERVAIKND